MMSSPRVDRPQLPDGYGVDTEGHYLTWEEVEDRLIESLHYWLSTTRADGRPHTVPRWGVWLDGRFWYDGSPQTRHVQNLGSSGPCVLHLESGQLATIVEGVSEASQPVFGDLGQRLSAEFQRKYSNDYAPEQDAWAGHDAGGLRSLAPHKALAWSQFPADLTRFTFDADPP